VPTPNGQKLLGPGPGPEGGFQTVPVKQSADRHPGHPRQHREAWCADGSALRAGNTRTACCGCATSSRRQCQPSAQSKGGVLDLMRSIASRSALGPLPAIAEEWCRPAPLRGRARPQSGERAHDQCPNDDCTAAHAPTVAPSTCGGQQHRADGSPRCGPPRSWSVLQLPRHAEVQNACFRSRTWSESSAPVARRKQRLRGEHHRLRCRPRDVRARSPQTSRSACTGGCP
jgi:hypothetical protein